MDISGNGVSSDDFYAIGTLAVYANDDLRLSIGAGSVAGFESAHAGLEWFMGETGLPLSLTVDGQLGEDGYTSVMAGISFYFGGDNKSLIRRHREDDPRLHNFNIFNAGLLGSGALDGGPQCSDEPESQLPPCSPA